MCQQTMNLMAIIVVFVATLILAYLGVRGVSVNRNGSMSIGGAAPPPTDPAKRKRWAFRRYWAYKLGLPIGAIGVLIACVLQAVAIYLPQCT